MCKKPQMTEPAMHTHLLCFCYSDMEDKEYVVSVPTLLRKLSSREITGFDVNKTGIANDRFELSRYQSCNSSEATVSC